MDVKTQNIELTCKPDEMHDITGQVERFLKEIGAREGCVVIFAIGSTCGITTIEYEPGLSRDFPDMLDRIAPPGHYHHDATWGDGNGHSHLRSSLVGTSFIAPVLDGKLLNGTWQQIIFCSFDVRSRQRKVVLQFLGETTG